MVREARIRLHFHPLAQKDPPTSPPPEVTTFRVHLSTHTLKTYTAKLTTLIMAITGLKINGGYGELGRKDCRLGTKRLLLCMLGSRLPTLLVSISPLLWLEQRP